MQSPWLVIGLSLFFAVAGVYYFFRNLSLWRDDTKLYAYLENTPKAKIWVAKLGIDRTAVLTKKYFIPFGFLMCIVMAFVGFRNVYLFFLG